MRILIANSNTSAFVTEKVGAAARAAASPGVDIVTATGKLGARIIKTRSQNAIATYSMLLLLAEHHKGCDAVVIAVSYDTALAAARELLPIPAVGMTEASLLTALMLGSKVGVVVVGRRTLPLYRELIDGYGLSARIAGARAIESAAPYQDGDQTEADELVAGAARELVDADGADVVVLTGAVMAGVPSRLQHRVPVPLLDGITCGVRQAELLVRFGLKKPSAGSYASPPATEMVGLPDSLARLFAK